MESIVGAARMRMEHTLPIAFFRICRYASTAFDLVMNPMRLVDGGVGRLSDPGSGSG